MVTPPWCWDVAAASRGSGYGLEQGTLPILGSVQELPPVLQPRGHRREPRKSGNAQGRRSCAPQTTRLPCLHCQAWGLHPIPRGCGMQPRGSGTSGSPPGPACPAPATLGPSQARDGGGGLDPHGKLGSHWCHWYPPNSSPALTKPSSQQGLGGVFSHLFSQVFQ